eukprot:PITA_20636
MVDPANIAIILNLEAPRSVKQLRATLGHTGYYRKFIKRYAEITALMDKLLKKDVTFCWNDDFMKSLDVIKEKLASAPILVFPKWDVEFHVHVDASCRALGAVLTQEGREGLDHPIVFASHRWLLLFQEYDFEVVVKPRRLNAGPDHLSRIETGKEPTSLEEGLPDAQLFVVRIAGRHFEDIIHFLMTGIALKEYSVQNKKELVVRASHFSVITGHLYKMGSDEIL